MSNLVFDSLCGTWKSSKSCCSDVGSVTIVTTLDINLKPIDSAPILYILEDGTSTETPPTGIDCGCGAATPPVLYDKSFRETTSASSYAPETFHSITFKALEDSVIDAGNGLVDLLQGEIDTFSFTALNDLQMQVISGLVRVHYTY